LTRRSSLDFAPYLAPYALFLVLVTLGAPLALRVAAPGALLALFAWRGSFPELRGYRVRSPGALADGLFGLAIAVLWVGPYLALDALPRPAPGEGFDPSAPFGESGRSLALAVRLVGFAGVTPFVEELFVRSFLIRYVDVFDRGGDFRELPIGRFAWRSFLVTSLYFALSHARWEWPVALATGVLFNLWLYRRRSLGALVLAHAVANAAIWAAVVSAPEGLATLGGRPLDPWIFL
jgi:CAAX prenyl protease-like protein